MVYQGPSRGCNSCKLRRKKCDETRPSCMRCIRAKRSCGGYDVAALSVVRQYKAPGNGSSPSFTTAARKCSLPARTPLPGTDIIPEDTIPVETTSDESDMLAFRAFLFDFCVISSNHNISRGFLSSLELVARRLGPKSNLVKACQAISFGSHSKPLNRPNIAQKAAGFYQELLGTFARALADPASADAKETRLIAMLLGLYQMAVSSESYRGDHDAHARGLAALMGLGKLPFELLDGAELGLDSFLRISGIFSTPALNDPSESLDDLLVNLLMVWKLYDKSSDPGDLESIRSMCLALHRRFVRWKESRPAEFVPTVIGHSSWNPSIPIPTVGAWPGKIESYFDLYTAGVWNIFRTAQLVLIALIVGLSEQLGENDTCSDHVRAGYEIFEDLAASIPYHLTGNLQSYIKELPTNGEITDPGKLLGGLLLIHPLYVISRVPFLTGKMRNYMLLCLDWIGSRMGLGQAALLSKSLDVDKGYLASGCMIIWFGFLG